jgi:hypothetical protein
LRQFCEGPVFDRPLFSALFRISLVGFVTLTAPQLANRTRLLLLSICRGISMAKKKTELERVADRAAKIIQAQLDTLPVDVAKKKVKELEQIAAKAYRNAKSGTGRQAQRTGAIRLSTRSRARTV